MIGTLNFQRRGCGFSPSIRFLTLCGQKIKIFFKKCATLKVFNRFIKKNYSVLFTFMCYIVPNEHKLNPSRKGNFFSQRTFSYKNMQKFSELSAR